MDIQNSTVGTETINGVEVTIKIGSDGDFYARLGDRISVSASTYKDLKARIRRELKKDDVRVAIPFRRVDGERLIATGMHRGMGKIVVTVGSKTEYYEIHSKVYETATPEAIFDELATLAKEGTEIRKRIREIEEDYTFMLGHRLREVLDAATGKAMEQEDAIDSTAEDVEQRLLEN